MCDHTNQFEDMTHMVTWSYCCVALTPTSLLPFLYYPVFCLFQVFVMYGYLGLCFQVLWMLAVTSQMWVLKFALRVPGMLLFILMMSTLITTCMLHIGCSLRKYYRHTQLWEVQKCCIYHNGWKLLWVTQMAVCHRSQCWTGFLNWTLDTSNETYEVTYWNYWTSS